MSDLYNHVKKDKVKWAMTAIAFVIVFVFIIGMLLQFFLPDGKRPLDWFNPKEEQEEPVDEVNNGGMVIADSGSSNNISVMSYAITSDEYSEYGISPLAESAQVLTATVTPAEATITTLQWAVEWDKEATYEGNSTPIYEDDSWYADDDGNEWATYELEGIGITENDFVQLAVSGDTLSCTVTCTQPFGCPMIITVKSVDNPLAYDTCSVGYYRRFKSFNFGGSDITLSDTGKDITYTYSLIMTPGTVYPDYTVSAYVQGGFDWRDFLLDECGLSAGEYALDYGCVWEAMDNYITSSGVTSYDEEGSFDFTSVYGVILKLNTNFEDFAFKYCTSTYGTSLTTNQRKVVLEKVRTILNDERVKSALAVNPLFTVKVWLSNSTTGEMLSEEKAFYLKDVSGVSSFVVPVTSVSVSGDIIF